MKKKMLLLGTTVAATVALVGTVIAVSQTNGLLESRANEKAAGSIVFSRSSGSFTKIDDRTASVSGRTPNGATYYAVSHNFEDISGTNKVASFFFNPLDPTCPTSDEQYVSFTASASSDTDFEFQAITGIKVTTTSSVDQSLYVYYSDDGETFCGDTSAILITANNNPSKVSFNDSYKYVRLGTQSGQTRNITEIELFYDCGGSPEPGEKTLTSIEVKSPKTRYGQGAEFVEPQVEATYSTGEKEIVSGATFTDYDLSTLGIQTVTVTYQNKTTTFEIDVRPTETSKKISYNAYDADAYEFVEISEIADMDHSTFQYYAESGSTVTFTPSFKPGITVLGVEDWDLKVEEINEQDGTYSFTMCNYFDVTITVAYRVQPVFTGIRVDNPQTTYYVGDAFVKPSVYAVYTTGEELLTSGVTFSGFDSAEEVASQTITASYTHEGVVYTDTYTIEVLTKGGQESSISGTYSLTVESTFQVDYLLYKTFTLTFSATSETAGTGTYNYHRENTKPDNLIVYDSTVNFTYVMSGNSITIRFASYGVLYETKADGSAKTETYKRNYFDGNNPFQASADDWTSESTNSTLVFDGAASPNTVTIGIYGVSGSTTTNRTLVKQ